MQQVKEMCLEDGQMSEQFNKMIDSGASIYCVSCIGLIKTEQQSVKSLINNVEYVAKFE